MLLSDFIASLQDLAEQVEAAGIDEPQVMVAIQPHYPVAVEPVEMTVVGDRLFIATDGSPYERPYAPRAAWDGGIAQADEDD